jgi:tetratricopeptide (TPR) repeat protein
VRAIHDDGFELFLDGQQILSRTDFKTGYAFFPVDLKAFGLLKSGTNTLAVHCSSAEGAQFIDVGLLGLSLTPLALQQRLTAMTIADPWAKLAVAYHVIGDEPAKKRLLEHHPAAATGIGDLYAANQDWERAIAQYNKAISPQCQDATIFAARAEAHEKLEHWELAAADWGNTDHYAVDKKLRYGSNPSAPALERRAWMHGRLQQFDKQIPDYTEILKPERFGDNPWFFAGRGAAYCQLRQWDKGRADLDRAIKVAAQGERFPFYFSRARVLFAAQGQWKPAEEDLRQVYQKPAAFRDGPWPRAELWALGEAALIYAIAGDVENYRNAVAECYRKQSTGTPNAYESKLTVLSMLLFPEMITNANRPRLLELAGKTDAYWRPRLTAGIQFRGGDSQKAAEFFDANDPGAYFLFLAALTYHKAGNPDRARQRLDEGNSWLREQREKDPGSGVPRSQFWQDWAAIVTLQYEASELILGSSTGSNQLPERAVGDARFQVALARHLAERGNAPLADAARAKARILFEEKLVKEPANSAWAAELAELLLLQSRTKTSAGGVALAERFVRLGRQNQANGIDLFDYGADGVTEPAEIEEQQCRLVQTGSRGWGHAYFAIEKGFKWAPSMNVLVEIDYWCDSSGNFQVQFDSPHDSYDKSQAPVQLDGLRGWRTARFALIEARFANSQNGRADFRVMVSTAGRFYLKRVSVRRLIAAEVADDPWLKLAASYKVIGDQQALDKVLKHHPEAASAIGDVYADLQDWERAIAEYRKRATDPRADVALLTKLAMAYQSAGRTREAILPLAQASAANPKDTILSLKVAALQAWFGQEKELAATWQRVRTFAKDTKEASTAERAAKVCSLLPTADKAELDAALALARKGVELDQGNEWREWRLLALGMAEYRSGNHAAAIEALLAAAKAGSNNPIVTGVSAFYRAMSLSRQGKSDEARKLAIGAAAQMKPLPKDEQNPPAGDAYWDDLILWLAYKEAKAMIHFDAAPVAPERPARK